MVNLTSSENGIYRTAKALITHPWNGDTVEAHVLLDTGSSGTYIIRKITQQLQNPVKNQKELDIIFFRIENIAHICTKEVSFRLCTNNFQINILAHTTLYKNIEALNIVQFQNLHPQYAAHSFADTANGEEIDILLGNEYRFHLLLSDKIQVTNDFFLINSVFGWFIVR